VYLGQQDGDWFSARVTGYQFPDAEDPRRRFSWHVLAGDANCADGAWSFAWAAMACHESPLVSDWLREAASGRKSALVDREGWLRFTEPNLSFRVAEATDDAITIEVAFDLEFQPPWHRRRGAGDPFVVRLQSGPEQLLRAANEWDHERAPFPDGP